MPYTRSDEWLRIFGNIAERIARDINPRSALDAGCALGFLVECLRDRSIEAFGVDVSEYAIQRVREDMRPYCWVGSVLEPLPRRYDLIVCIEVLEHLTAQECEQAVTHFCQASDDILFSSTPDDFREATHINVHTPDYWAGLFARHGFYHDVDFDATFITAWAMRFRRSSEPAYRVVEAYERRLWQVSKEIRETRAFALDSRNQLADREAHLALARGQLGEAQARTVQATTERDIAQAQTTQAIAERDRAQSQLVDEQRMRQQSTRQVTDILGSPGWRFVQYVGRVRARLCPPGSRRERLWLGIIRRLI